MVIQSKEAIKGSKEAQAKTLIMKAWRERWTDIQWGIHVRSLIDKDTGDASFIANCILQQALNGPGPNSLVLSYLMHSIYSQIISPSSVLKSVSQYDGYHKPFCIGSLLDLLDNIKHRIILNDREDKESCVELSAALASIVHWLLTCMYSSLESLSDLSITDLPADMEDSKIVIKCRTLLQYFLLDPFLSALIHCAVLEDENSHLNIKKMCGDVAKFADGHHQKDINLVLELVEKIGKRSGSKSSEKIRNMGATVDDKQMIVGCPSIQSTVMCAALLRSSNDVPNMAIDLIIIKQLKNLSSVELLCEVLHSSLIGMVDSLGKEQEMKLIGFLFLQLPSLLNTLKEHVGGSNDDFVKALELFLGNESLLDIADAKLHCSTLELLLTSFHKLGLINETEKQNLLKRKVQTHFASKQNSSNAVLILKAESTVLSIIKTLDGDFVKNQDAILGVLSDMLGKSFELILTAASATGRIQQLSSKLMSLNQCSRQVTGEAGKASATRAMIFDISFLMLCNIVQTYGSQAICNEEADSFFLEWFQDCMVEHNTAKNPDTILNRCDQNKVEILLNQHLQGDTELKTSLVFWHELCTNSVGVVREILLAWECESVSFADVKKILDVFRSRICSLPVCISAWLCAHIQMTPEEQSGKARYILNHFLNPVTTEEPQDNFKERSTLMNKIINKMIQSIQPVTSSSPTSPFTFDMESKPVADLYKKCWTCIECRGLIDIDTTFTLKSLLDISGPHYFVQNMIKEMMEIQCSVELLQWTDLLYGVFHVDLSNCAAALLRVVVPSILHYWNRESNFVEPQLLALASLSVDCILSYYFHAKAGTKDERMDIGDDGEPNSKRRKISDTNIVKKESMIDLDYILKELYEEFDKVLMHRNEARAQAVFVLRFLEQLSMKTPDLELLHGLPNRIITQLMSLMCEEINTKMLLGWYPLKEKSGRANCALSICNLKHMQNINVHRFTNFSS